MAKGTERVEKRPKKQGSHRTIIRQVENEPADQVAVSFENQTDVLATPQLQSAQRASLATGLGRVNGNRNLQRLISAIQQRRPEHNTLQLSPLSSELEMIWIGGNKGEFFERLRNVNVSDPDLEQFVERTLVGDDLWLSRNLLRYGREANWPIHLRVEREMKGWGDSLGKGEVFNILRAANGSAATNPDLTSVINRVFAPGTEDLALAQNLQAYGPEAKWAAPTPKYVIPFDRNPLSAPGEQIIFGAEYTYPLSFNYHKIVYTAQGGTFDTTSGPTSKTHNGLDVVNQYFFIDAGWNGTSDVKVQLEVKCRSNDLTVLTENWTFGKKQYYPTSITQQEGENEVPLPGVYSYKLGPDRGGDQLDDYIGQTILEKFEPRTSNLTVDDLKDEFKAANPTLTTPAAIAYYFFGGSGRNGTFTVSAGDMIYDQHSGGMPDLSVFQNALKTMKEITVDLPQTYEAKPGVTLGKFIVRRILKTDGTKMVKKMKQT
jgi:hypothetical protein